MSRHRPTLLPLLSVGAALLVGVTLETPAAADDWPQWRGVHRDGRSAETGLLASWPDGGPPKLWTAHGFGTGFSSVAVAGRRMFTTGDLADGQYVIAAREGDGTFIWRAKIGPVWGDADFPGARSTPTVSGDRVYALGTEGDLVCLSAQDGKELWRRNLASDFGGKQMKAGGEWTWKFSESPLVHDGRVIVTPGSQDALLVALDAQSGKEIWRTKVDRPLGDKGDDGAGYSSVVVGQGGGVTQYVTMVGRGLVGVEAATGKLLWHYNPVANNVANIPTPLISGDFVFGATGYGTGAGLVQLAAAAGGGVTAKEVYFLAGNVFQNHHGNMILEGGTVYAGHGHNRGYPMAVDLATGKVLWGPVENKGNGSAAVAWAEGRLYLRYQNGLMVLAETAKDAYREHGSFMIPEVKRQSWAHPVIANGRLILREQDAIHVYDIKAR
jgi:outer membrane protein assembly factor BamB